MKNTGKCTKCGSGRVRYLPGGVAREDQDHMVMSFWGPFVRVGRYYCLDCGFTEEWIDDLDKVQE